MRVVTAGQMREMDRKAAEEYGIPGIILMEHAGLRVAEAIMQNCRGRNIVILAGRGNNGGDGFVAARLLSRQRNVTVWTMARPEQYGGDALVNLKILQNCGLTLSCLDSPDLLPSLESGLASADVIVDALFGTGLARDVEPLYAAAIRLVNQSGAFVVSVDIPSGICADTGRVLGEAVRADLTVTFACPKRGLVLYPGAAHSKRWQVADIGMPKMLTEGDQFILLTEAYIKKLLPQRADDSHKGSHGAVLLVAGSAGMSGAAALAARAALRGGCGLLYVALPKSVQPIVAAQVAEAITIPLAETPAGSINPAAGPQLQNEWKKARAVAMGPGIRAGAEQEPVLADVVRHCPLPLVLDADALNLLARQPQLMEKRSATTVLTPHPGEAARLLDKSVLDITSDRPGAAAALAAKYGCIVVLKGANSLIAAPDGRLAVNPTGNSGMATAGSGDVLTGLLASLLAQGLNGFYAAQAAVYLHGLAGDMAALKKGKISLVASDLAEFIAEAYRKVL